ncbi:hypothetical protein BBFL7_01577 [Flavobacteria bacterium BBFL7]|nr:hypothetical protein BBFL7_01577 [Flavobacteria bacterium BBFL7]
MKKLLFTITIALLATFNMSGQNEIINNGNFIQEAITGWRAGLILQRGGNIIGSFGSDGINKVQLFTGSTIDNTTARLTINNVGNIGIGTSNPLDRLHLSGNLRLSHPQNTPVSDGIYWDFRGRAIEQFSSDGQSKMIRFTNSMAAGNGNPQGGFSFTDHVGTNVLRINNYRVGIGTNTLTESLTVNGNILAEEVRVIQDVLADYVFESYYTGTSKLKPEYTMPTLDEVEAYTKENNHLPEMPSAQEIKDDGLELSKMTNLLLQKIEELTLYTIEQEKRIKVLEAKLTNTSVDENTLNEEKNDDELENQNQTSCQE